MEKETIIIDCTRKFEGLMIDNEIHRMISDTIDIINTLKALADKQIGFQEYLQYNKGTNYHKAKFKYEKGISDFVTR